MAHYIKYSTRIYEVYMRYVDPEDVHVYSIDEVFIDATPYLSTYKMTAHELAMKMIREVLAKTGITATAGIGTNMYLCKIAMDIVAKKMQPDKDGVRIAELDEMSYRRQALGAYSTDRLLACRPWNSKSSHSIWYYNYGRYSPLLVGT